MRTEDKDLHKIPQPLTQVGIVVPKTVEGVAY